LMAGLFTVLPKVGALHAIDFKEPTPKTEDLYFKSVDQTVDRFGKALTDAKNKDLQTPNIDLDTGKPTSRGEYPLADYTYRELLDDLADSNFQYADDALRQNIIQFYEGFGVPVPDTRIDNCVCARWRKTWVEVNQLRAFALLDPEEQAQPAREETATRLQSGSGLASCAGDAAPGLTKTNN